MMAGFYRFFPKVNMTSRPDERYDVVSPVRNERRRDGIPGPIDETTGLCRQILRKMENMMADLKKLTADIAAQKTVLAGVVIGVQALNASNAAQTQQIADLKAALAAAGVEDPGVQAAIDALDQSVQDNTTLVSGLVPAVTQNTSVSAATAEQAATDATVATGA